MGYLGPDLCQWLAQWWGGSYENYACFASVTNAANIVFGTNPLYQISDFLAIYPKFGTDLQAIIAAAPSPSAPGISYAVNDVLNVLELDALGGTLKVTGVGAGGAITSLAVVNGGTGYQVTSALNAISALAIAVAGIGYLVGDTLGIVQAGGSGGTLLVNAVNGSGGITGFTLAQAGQGYAVQNGVATSGGHGSGATVNITAILEYVGALTTGGSGSGAQVLIQAISAYSGLVPQAVLQLYINLATASLSQARWLELWPMGMALYIAHYATLYLQSEGNVGTTAQQVAASGLQKGLIVSQAAGDVSQSREYLAGWEEWGAWNYTSYGIQLATMAEFVGAGPMYIR